VIDKPGKERLDAICTKIEKQIAQQKAALAR